MEEGIVKLMFLLVLGLRLVGGRLFFWEFSESFGRV